jgi:hypothetical protein
MRLQIKLDRAATKNRNKSVEIVSDILSFVRWSLRARAGL